MNKKHVLLVGGMRHMHDILRKQGEFETSIILMSNTIQERDGKDNARVVTAATQEYDEWLRLAQVVHDISPITHVVAFHEFHQDKAARIAEHLGLSFSNTFDTVTTVRDKYATRQKLRDAGIDDVKSYLIASADDVERSFEFVGLPAIIKPLDAWGSTDIRLIRTAQEAHEFEAHHRALEAERPQARFVAETFLHGEEYSVEAISENGEHRVVGITKKFKAERTFVEYGHLFPAPLMPDREDAIEGFVERCLDALGVQNGVTHTEVISDGQQVHLIETHTRCGGDMIMQLVRLSAGLDLEELYCRQVLGEPVLAIVDEQRQRARQTYACIWYGTPEAAGAVVGVEGLDDAKAVVGVTDVDVLKPVGSTLGPVNNSFDRAVHVICRAASADEALHAARDAHSKISFLVKSNLTV